MNIYQDKILFIVSKIHRLQNNCENLPKIPMFDHVTGVLPNDNANYPYCGLIDVACVTILETRPPYSANLFTFRYINKILHIFCVTTRRIRSRIKDNHTLKQRWISFKFIKSPVNYILFLFAGLLPGTCQNIIFAFYLNLK